MKRSDNNVEETRQPKKQRTADAEEIMRPKKKQTVADAEKSPYLVVGHGCVRPAYTGSGGRDNPMSIPRRLARLKCKEIMSFVPLRLKHRRWIVGVGGSSTKSYYGPGTIIFDTEKQSVIQGPEPKSIKSYPVLLPIDHKIYTLSRSPSMTGLLDFVPWFEVLDLSKAQEVDGRLINCKWRRLNGRPSFPGNSPQGSKFIRPPNVTVKSYASVGSRILVSVTGQVGTFAFDTNSNKWSTVDDKNSLPFVEGAIPHSPGLLLGLSRTRKAITGYKINVDGDDSLSVVEIPVVSELEDEEPIRSSYNFLSLGIEGASL